MGARRALRPAFRRTSANGTWARTNSIVLTTVAANTKVLLATVTPSITFDETIRRTRGVLWVQSDQAAANEQQFGAMGIIEVTDEAVTIGITAIPDPIGNSDDDGWMLYVPFQQSTNGGANNGLGFRYDFDSKAMRRIGEGRQMAIVVSNGHASHGLSLSLSLSLYATFRR